MFKTTQKCSNRSATISGPTVANLALVLVVLGALTSTRCCAGEVLYNGIRLPDQWPPRINALPARLPRPAYLVQPPDVLRIDVGRQLFVDDFLIEGTNMTRQFHNAVYHPANPILTCDRAWEMSDAAGGLPTACPYSGGVWYDPARKKFRMWYMGRYVAGGGPGFTAHHDTAGIAAYSNGSQNYQPLVKQPTETNRLPISDAIPCKRGLVTWLKADAIKDAANNGLVATWRDSAGNGMNCEQNDGKKQPHWIRVAIGGRPAV